MFLENMPEQYRFKLLEKKTVWNNDIDLLLKSADELGEIEKDAKAY